VLLASKELGIKAKVDSLPKRQTSSDRIQNFATATSLMIIEQGAKEPQGLINKLGFAHHRVQCVDTTDGLRMELTNGAVIHLRPSGNAPELRCYAEASDNETAQSYVRQTLAKVRALP
jgi:phosphomannomutase